MLKEKHTLWCAIVALVMTTCAVAAPPPDLEALWAFDEGSGTAVTDSSGNGHDGAIVGTMQWAQGVFGTALQINGTSGERVVMEGYAGVVGVADRTALAWIKTAVPGDFLTWGTNATGTKWMIRVDASGAGAGKLRTEAAGGYIYAVTDLRDDEWHHIASVLESAGTPSILDVTHYVDGQPDGVTNSQDVAVNTASSVVWIGDGLHDRPYTGLIDEVAVFSRALTQDEIQAAMAGLKTTSGRAQKPSPGSESQDILRDGVQLGWQVGPFAQTHDLYLGTVVEDVNDATVENPLSATVHAGLDVNSLALGRLDFDTTYYWRVDEVNAPADPGVFKGEVWSFSVEPEAIPVASVSASASGADDDKEPDRTVDGSGLDALGQHSTDNADMWQATVAEAGEAWVAYDFGKVCKLHQMRVWNHNSQTESILGYGIQEALIEISPDGVTWTDFKTVQIDQASGSDDDTGVIIPLDGIVAQTLRITALSNWSQFGFKTYGLSEVRFYAIPMVARNPLPVSGAADVAPQVALSWRSGREADRHEILLGADPNVMEVLAVADSTVHEVSLDLDQTYTWQVQEVNETETPAVWEGELWQFTTASAIGVDDFEMYSGQEGERIYEFWVDGYDNPGENGAVVGNGDDPETNTVYEGMQSMPLAYGVGGVNRSHTTRTFDPPLVANRHGVQTLSLQVHGATDNVAGQLFLEVNGQKVADYPGSPEDLLEAQWHTWPVDVEQAGLSSIQSLTIGITGGSGTVFIDAIALYPKAAELITPVLPDEADRVAYYPFDGDAADAAGNHDGTLVNSPAFVAGKQGQTLSFAGTEYVSVAYAPSLGLQSFTVSTWVNITDPVGNRGILGTRFNGDFTFDVKVNNGIVHGDIGDGSAWLSTALDILGTVGAGAWHHIAYAIDAETETAALYLDGLAGGTVTFSGPPLFMQEGQELRIGLSSGTEFMVGQIDELALYNRALSAEEIAGLAGLAGVNYKPL